MFPYVCLATMPLFCRVDWPRRLGLYFRRNSIDANSVKETDNQAKESLKPNCLMLPSSEILHNETIHEGK